MEGGPGMSCDILSLTYASHGRDVDISEPILSYLEIRYGLNIKRGALKEYPFLYKQLKPKMVMLPARGGYENTKAIRFAKNIGLAVVGLESEGDYGSIESLRKWFWQVTKREYAQPDLYLFWSSRAATLMEEAFPGDVEEYNMHVGGGTGFDKYKIIAWMGKKEFLHKYNLGKYDKMIGFAGWGFDDYEISRVSVFHQDSVKLLNAVLRELIEYNTDTVFLLKEHPEVTLSPEFQGLSRYNNVIVFRREENIADLINVCDLWMGYETTTAMEAWLLGKTTFLINPLGSWQERSRIAAGSPIYKTAEEIQKRMDEFYAAGKIEEFDKLASVRGNIIKDVMEFEDGKNHIRAGELIYELLKKYKPQKVRDGYNWRMDYMKTMSKKIVWNLLFKHFEFTRKLTPTYAFTERIYDNADREGQHMAYFYSLRRFYENLKGNESLA